VVALRILGASHCILIVSEFGLHWECSCGQRSDS